MPERGPIDSHIHDDSKYVYLRVVRGAMGSVTLLFHAIGESHFRTYLVMSVWFRMQRKRCGLTEDRERLWRQARWLRRACCEETKRMSSWWVMMLVRYHTLTSASLRVSFSYSALTVAAVNSSLTVWTIQG